MPTFRCRAPDDAVMAPADEIRAMLDWVLAAWTGAGRSDRQKLRQDHRPPPGPQRAALRPVVHGDADPDRQAEVQARPGHPRQQRDRGRPAARGQGVQGHGRRSTTTTTPRACAARVAVQRRDRRQGGAAHPDAQGRPGARAGRASPIPQGTRESSSRWTRRPTAPAYDQADWADARVILGDGKTVWLDETRRAISWSGRSPFSFRYGRRASAEAPERPGSGPSKTTDGEEKLQHDLDVDRSEDRPVRHGRRDRLQALPGRGVGALLREPRRRRTRRSSKTSRRST